MTERRKPEERRREIADAVLKIVAERGLGTPTAVEIAREVGVTDAALFHHFRSMDEIVLAAIDRVEEMLFSSGLPDDSDPFVRLGVFFRQRVATMYRNPGAGRLVLSDVLTQLAPPEGAAKARALQRRSVGFIRTCLRDAARQGLLAEGVAVEDATVVVLGSLMALTKARDLVGDGPIEPLVGNVWRNLERALCRRRAIEPRAGSARRQHSNDSTQPRSTSKRSLK